MRAWTTFAWVAVACFALALCPPQVGRAGESDRSATSDVEAPLVALGRRLFQDPTVSRTGTRSCASCHDPEHGWSDAKTLSDDADGPTRRHSQPVVDLVGADPAGDGFHWDGEFRTTTEVVSARLADRDDVMPTFLERFRRRQQAAVANGKNARFSGGQYGAVLMAGPEVGVTVGQRVARERRYDAAFAAAFGDDGATSKRVVQAVDAFVRSLKTDRNALDRRLAGDAGALSASAQRGLELFKGRAACSTCHVLDVGADGRAALTDRRYHDTGVAFVNPRPEKKAGVSFATLDASGRVVFDQGPDDGRGGETFADADVGSFKTPSLRDVARRAPYMHDGSLATLADVVAYYSKGCTPNAHLDPAIKKLELTDVESADLVAFLESLSGDARPGALPARTTEKRIRAAVVDIEGRVMRDLDVEVVPCGETLGGSVPTAAKTKTSDVGALEFAFPQTTHVTLRADGLQLAGGRPIPDVAGDLRVVAARTDRVYVYFRRRGADMPERLVGATPDASSVLSFGKDETVREFTVSVELSPEFKAASSRASETFVFERIGTPGPDGALYSAPLDAARGTKFLKFRFADGTDVAAAVDLSGGDAGQAWLMRVVTSRGMRVKK